MGAARGIDWSSEPLGRVPDRQLARALGVTPRAVSLQRERRGVPRYNPPQPALGVWVPLAEGMAVELARVAAVMGVTSERMAAILVEGALTHDDADDAEAA